MKKRKLLVSIVAGLMAAIMVLTWVAFPTPKAAINPNILYKEARSQNLRGKPLRMICIGPPIQSPLLSLVRKCTANVASANLMIIPRRPQIHIQKMAPGPPMAIAPATPAKFPVPTVAASAVHKARKGLTPLRSLF